METPNLCSLQQLPGDVGVSENEEYPNNKDQRILGLYLGPPWEAAISVLGGSAFRVWGRSSRL